MAAHISVPLLTSVPRWSAMVDTPQPLAKLGSALRQSRLSGCDDPQCGTCLLPSNHLRDRRARSAPAQAA